MLSLRKTFKRQHAQRISGRDVCKVEYLKAVDMAFTRTIGWTVSQHLIHWLTQCFADICGPQAIHPSNFGTLVSLWGWYLSKLTVTKFVQ